MNVLLALLIMTPLALLVVGTIRGRVQVRSCCAVPAELDARLSPASDGPVADAGAHEAQNAPTGSSSH